MFGKCRDGEVCIDLGGGRLEYKGEHLKFKELWMRGKIGNVLGSSICEFRGPENSLRTKQVAQVLRRNVMRIPDI